MNKKEIRKVIKKLQDDIDYDNRYCSDDDFDDNFHKFISRKSDVVKEFAAQIEESYNQLKAIRLDENFIKKLTYVLENYVTRKYVFENLNYTIKYDKITEKEEEDDQKEAR